MLNRTSGVTKLSLYLQPLGFLGITNNLCRRGRKKKKSLQREEVCAEMSFVEQNSRKFSNGPAALANAVAAEPEAQGLKWGEGQT